MNDDPYLDRGRHGKDYQINPKKNKRSSQSYKPTKEQLIDFFHDQVTKRSKILLECFLPQYDIASFVNEPWTQASIKKSIKFIMDTLDPAIAEYIKYRQELGVAYINNLKHLNDNSPELVKLRGLQEDVRKAFARYPKFPFERGRRRHGGY